MQKKKYMTVDQLLNDKSFLNCYYRTDPEEFQRWQDWINESAEHSRLAKEAIRILSIRHQAGKTGISPEQVDNNFSTSPGKRSLKKIFRSVK